MGFDGAQIFGGSTVAAAVTVGSGFGAVALGVVIVAGVAAWGSAASVEADATTGDAVSLEEFPRSAMKSAAPATVVAAANSARESRDGMRRIGA